MFISTIATPCILRSAMIYLDDGDAPPAFVVLSLARAHLALSSASASIFGVGG